MLDVRYVVGLLFSITSLVMWNKKAYPCLSSDKNQIPKQHDMLENFLSLVYSLSI